MMEFSLKEENRYAYYLLKGSATAFMFILGRCLYCNNNEKDGVAAFNHAKYFYQRYLQAATIALKNDLLRNDYSAYNIKEKLK